MCVGQATPRSDSDWPCAEQCVILDLGAKFDIVRLVEILDCRIHEAHPPEMRCTVSTVMPSIPAQMQSMCAATRCCCSGAAMHHLPHTVAGMCPSLVQCSTAPHELLRILHQPVYSHMQWRRLHTARTGSALTLRQCPTCRQSAELAAHLEGLLDSCLSRIHMVSTAQPCTKGRALGREHAGRGPPCT